MLITKVELLLTRINCN